VSSLPTRRSSDLVTLGRDRRFDETKFCHCVPLLSITRRNLQRSRTFESIKEVGPWPNLMCMPYRGQGKMAGAVKGRSFMQRHRGILTLTPDGPLRNISWNSRKRSIHLRRRGEAGWRHDPHKVASRLEDLGYVGPQVRRQSVTWLDCFHAPPAGHPLPNDFAIFCVICCDSSTNRRPSSAAICIRCEAHFVHVSSASGTERTALSLFAKSDHRETSDCTRASQARLA